MMSLGLARVSGMFRCNRWASGVEQSSAGIPTITPQMMRRAREEKKDYLRSVRDELKRRGLLPKNYSSINPDTILAYLRRTGARV